MYSGSTTNQYSTGMQSNVERKSRTVSLGSVVDEEENNFVFRSMPGTVPETKGDAKMTKPSLEVADFFFQERFGKLDSRRLYRLNIDEIVQQVDLGTIHELIDNVAFSQLEEKDLQDLPDVVFVNAFKVAQLAIEYLANVQGSMNAHISNQDEFIDWMEHRLANVELERSKLARECSDVHRKLRHKNKLVQTFETLFSKGGNSENLNSILAGISSNITGEAHTCPTCTKVFASRKFLWQHCKRRGHHFPEEVADEEKKDMAGSKLLAETLAIRTMLEQAMTTKDKQFSSLIAEMKQEERDRYDTQLKEYQDEALQERSTLLAEHRTKLNTSALEYEKQIAQLESQLSSLEIQLRDKENDEKRRVAKLAHELEISLSKLEQLSSKQSVANVHSAPLPSAKRLAIRHVLSVFDKFKQRRISLAWNFWKSVANMHEDSQKENKNNHANISREQDAVEERVRRNSLEAMKEVDMDALVHNYVESRGHGDITEEHLKEMKAIDERVEEELAGSEMEIIHQQLKYMPDANKPYLRSRWQHSVEEVRARIKLVKRELKQQVDDYGCQVTNDGRLSAEQLRSAMEIVEDEFEDHPDIVRQALKASKSLIKQLTDVYYEGPKEIEEWKPFVSELPKPAALRMDSEYVQERNGTNTLLPPISYKQRNKEVFEQGVHTNHVIDEQSKPNSGNDSITLGTNDETVPSYLLAEQDHISREEDELQSLRNNIDSMREKVATLRSDEQDTRLASNRSKELQDQRVHRKQVREMDDRILALETELAKRKREIQMERDLLLMEKRKEQQNLNRAETGKQKRMQREAEFMKKREQERATELLSRAEKLATLEAEQRLLNGKPPGLNTTSDGENTLRVDVPPPRSPKPVQQSVAAVPPPLSPRPIIVQNSETKLQPPPLSPRPRIIVGKSQQKIFKSTVLESEEKELSPINDSSSQQPVIRTLPEFVAKEKLPQVVESVLPEFVAKEKLPQVVESVDIIGADEFHSIAWDNAFDL